MRGRSWHSFDYLFLYLNFFALPQHGQSYRFLFIYVWGWQINLFSHLLCNPSFCKLQQVIKRELLGSEVVWLGGARNQGQGGLGCLRACWVHPKNSCTWRWSINPLIFIIVQDKGHITTFATVLCTPHFIHPVWQSMHYLVQEVGTKQYSCLGKKAKMTTSQATTIKMAFTVSRHCFLLRGSGSWSRNNQSYDVITTQALVYGQRTKNCLNLRPGLFKERTDYIWPWNYN